ncbi:hypothetical protein PROFUN_00967 [Planoprotostelium fungivorum]|uniref:DNA2/NAM7 helicase-like C-terminal domain-containing protein n=1 Tax=Planoprotostelium fungivorum TaxID=1890364 RepID=A0A2P6N4B6_9EUKA|nr:hypothetical protein PROFUN_00967 [Planoprotostelium fungivorum]
MATKSLNTTLTPDDAFNEINERSHPSKRHRSPDGDSQERILHFCLLVAMAKPTRVEEKDLEAYMKERAFDVHPLRILKLGELCFGVVLSRRDQVGRFITKKHDVLHGTHLHFHQFTAKRNKEMFTEMDNKLCNEERIRQRNLTEKDLRITDNCSRIVFRPNCVDQIALTITNLSSEDLVTKAIFLTPRSSSWTLMGGEEALFIPSGGSLWLPVGSSQLIGLKRHQISFCSRAYDNTQLLVTVQFVGFCKTHTLSIPINDREASQLLAPTADFKCDAFRTHFPSDLHTVASYSLRDVAVVPVPISQEVILHFEAPSSHVQIRTSDSYDIPPSIVEEYQRPKEVPNPWNRTSSNTSDARMAQHKQLWMEELEWNTRLASMAQPVQYLVEGDATGLCQHVDQRYLFSFLVHGLQHKGVGPTDVVYLYHADTPKIQYEGVICAATLDVLTLALHPEFGLRFFPGSDLKLRYTAGRDHFRSMHMAIDRADVDRLCMPSKGDKNTEPIDPETIDWVRTKFTDEQKAAVISILNRTTGRVPLLLYGCMHSGKTAVLSEAAQQAKFLDSRDRNKILIVAKFEDSADRIITDITKDYNLNVLRFRLSGQKVTELTTQSEYIDINGQFIMPTSSELKDLDIIVTTYPAAFELSQVGDYMSRIVNPLQRLAPGHFSHVFMDEADRITVGEACLGLLVANRSTTLVLAGDEMAPKLNVRSKSHVRFTSVMSHVASTPVYNGNNSLRILRLNRCFLPHSFLGKILSHKVYHDRIQFTETEEQRPWYVGWSWLKEKTSTMFLNVSGVDMVEDNDPSLFNIEEISCVCMMILSLIDDKQVDVEDIEVMVPSTKQKEKMQRLLVERGLEVKVGLSGELHGPLPKALFVSTVRSHVRMDAHEIKYQDHYGFLFDNRFSSAALARGLGGIVGIIGNGLSLLRDPFWKSVIYNCKTQGTYWGPNLEDLQSMSDNLSKDNRAIIRGAAKGAPHHFVPFSLPACLSPPHPSTLPRPSLSITLPHPLSNVLSPTRSGLTIQPSPPLSTISTPSPIHTTPLIMSSTVFPPLQPSPIQPPPSALAISPLDHSVDRTPFYVTRASFGTPEQSGNNSSIGSGDSSFDSHGLSSSSISSDGDEGLEQVNQGFTFCSEAYQYYERYDQEKRKEYTLYTQGETSHFTVFPEQDFDVLEFKSFEGSYQWKIRAELRGRRLDLALSREEITEDVVFSSTNERGGEKKGRVVLILEREEDLDVRQCELIFMVKIPRHIAAR